MKLTAALVLVAALPFAVSAHHSRFEFGGDVRELEGEITQVMWFNPHAALLLKVAASTGSDEIWRIETFGAPRLYERAGVTSELFRVGERVTIAGRASTRRPLYFLGLNALLPNGSEVILAESGRHWTGDTVIGSAAGVSQPVDEAKLEAAAKENRGIFRVWSIPNRDVTTHLPFTSEALAARELWDPADNPIARCEQPGLPVTMTQPLPIEFIDGGTTITLRSPYFNTVRTIHMTSASDDDHQPPTHLGYSIGHWDGNTLAVETRAINYPYFDTRGTPQSDSVHITERFTLSADQSRLDFNMTVIDPVTLTEPATYQKTLLALGQTLEVYDCKVF